jgi:hypothetical protein
LLEIELAGDELTVQLNDVPVTRASAIEDVTGYIGIRSETSAVEFRRIDVEVVDSGPRASDKHLCSYQS